MKRINLLMTMLFLLFVHASWLNAQRIFSTSYTMDDGLAANRVSHILQDSCGFMWFSTNDGLSRFDGVKFKNYHLSEYVGDRTGNTTGKIFIDRRGKMWVGMDDGVAIYDFQQDSFVSFDVATDEGEMVRGYVNDMIEDSDGEVWIAVNGKGLYRYNPTDKRLIVYRHVQNQDNCIPQNRVMTLYQDSSRKIWMGTYSEGLCCFDKETERFVTYRKTHVPQSLSDNSIQKIMEDSHGNLWIGTFQSGLDLFNPLTQTFTNYRDESANSLLYHIQDIKEYRPGELYIASDNGIGIFNTERGEVVQSDNHRLNMRIGDNKFVYAIYVDKEENLWLGTYFDGIKFYSVFQNNFKYYSCSSYPDMWKGKVVNVIEEAGRGNFWIGTDNNGIFLFNTRTQKVTPFKNAEDMGTNYYCIHDLLMDGDLLYAATYERGLQVFNLKTGSMETHYHHPGDSTSIPSSRVFSLYKAGNGRIYVGTSNALCTYDPVKKNFHTIVDLQTLVSVIIEDYHGRIWVGTTGNGLYRYDVKTRQVTSYRDSNIPNMQTRGLITTLAIDKKHRLWIGTHGQGLYCYDEENDKFVLHDRLRLPNSIISSIIPKDDVLWISTNKGLAVYNPDNGSLKTYSKSNGLHNEQFTPSSGCEARDGRLFLGSCDGFCCFSPSQLRENTYNPPVVLTGMSIFGKDIRPDSCDSSLHHSITYTREITLKAHQSMIGFEFASLSYIAPQKNKYRYMLDGLDNEWQYTTGHHNHLSYANLPAGEYTLRIRGTNSDRQWSEHGVDLKIRVQPPFLQSPTAYALYALVLLLIIGYSIYYYIKRTEAKQRRRIRRMESEKEKELYNAKIEFFTNIAHEIRTPLSLIMGPLEYLMKSTSINDVYGEYLVIIEQNYKRLYALVTQLLDFQKVDTGMYKLSYDVCRIKETVMNVTHIFELSSRQKNIHIDTSGIADDLTIVTDEEAVTKIVSNLLSNALKYASARVEISVTADEREMLLTVADDGIGISDEEKHKIFDAFYQVRGDSETNRLGIGIGLHITRSLVKLMGGVIEVSDHGGEQSGTVIAVRLPLHASTAERRSAHRVEDTIIPDSHKEEARHDLLHGKEAEGKPFVRQYTVMAVDDNRAILDFLAKILSDEYFVISASGGAEALQIMDKNRIDLVISDVMMDEMDGFELCRLIKENINVSHIPVILLTAKADTDSKIKGLDVGANAYIEKPFSPSHLKAQIGNLLKEREKQQHEFATSPLAGLHQGNMQSKMDEKFMSRCSEIVLQNIENPDFSVNTLAQELNMSRTSVFTKIKGITGQTPNDFIKLMRLKQACKMLQEGEYKITEIGFLVGFNSSSYFAKCFQKQFGMLPTEFVKKLKE